MDAEKPESELLADEAERLITEINNITQQMSGVGQLPRRPKELRIERYRQLYDQRKTKIQRVEEIAKISLEKGYITD